jgi:hypothetical protein
MLRLHAMQCNELEVSIALKFFVRGVAGSNRQLSQLYIDIISNRCIIQYI